MRLQLHHQDFEELLVANDYPTNFVPDSGEVVERVFGASLLGGMGQYTEIYLENIHIGYGDIHFKDPVTILFETDFETVEMHFALAGDAIAKDKLSRKTIEFHRNQHNIMYANGASGTGIMQGSKAFEVNLNPAFFQRYLPDESPIFHQFLQALHKKQTGMMSENNYPITPAMHHLIREIMNCQRKGIFKKMFIESKVIELLLLQLEQISEFREVLGTSLKKEDIDKMYAVRQIIHDNVEQSQTLLIITNYNL